MEVLKKVLWYEDDEIKIEFDKTPHTTMLFPLPSMTEEEKRDIKKKPFLNKIRFFVTLSDKKEDEIEYKFLIEKGYRWDGATIPRILWRIIGAKTNPEFQIPSMIHDKLCENKEFINNNRLLSSKTFKGLLIGSGVNKLKANIMYIAVDNFQKLCGWGKKEIIYKPV